MADDWLTVARRKGLIVSEGPRAKLPHAAPAAGEHETVFTTRVIGLAQAHDWRVNHQLPLRTERGWATGTQGDIGFPDIVAARFGPAGVARLVIAELKVTTQVRPDQALWLAVFRAVPGVEVFVWRPENWHDIVTVFSVGHTAKQGD